VSAVQVPTGPEGAKDEKALLDTSAFEQVRAPLHRVSRG
jgi:hypothetical protein